MKKKNLLIEIYTEELPPKCIWSFIVQLPKVVKEVLEINKIEYKSFETYVTAVRIIIFVEDISEYTKKEEKEIIGPSVNIAIKNNEYTPAAIGFAKKYNVELKDLYVKDNKLVIKKIYGGEKVANVIPKILLEIITKFEYPKQMVWQDSRFKFPRPIRKILILFDNEVIKIKKQDSEFLSSCCTNSPIVYGIKTYPLKKIKIKPKRNVSLADSYFEVLKNENILFNHKERLEVLKKMLNNIIRNKDLKYDDDQELFKEIISIVEYPSCVVCELDKSFLSLPKEFIIICMKTKQKFIPIYDKDGNLTNMFIGVKNGTSEYLENVKNGYEKVLTSRLDDVKYYYEIDRKIDFHSRLEKLKGIVYNAKLDSSYYDKILRIQRLAKFLNNKLDFNIDEKIIEITSELIKNDITTQVVYEYPELQGVAGRIYCEEYCKQNNLPQEIALCCQQHYLPKGYNDDVPQSKLSILFSLASKISDVIDVCIIDGLPTGSSDVFGIKKTADGVIKICKELKLDLNLSDVVEYYIQQPITRTSLKGESVKWDLSSVKDKFLNFFSQRFENILTQEGYKIDEIRCVLFDFNGEFYTKRLVLDSIKNFREKEEFKKIIELYKRVNNILIQAKGKGFLIDTEMREDLLTVEEEKNLYYKMIDLKEKVNNFLKEKKFDEIILEFLSFKPTLDNFFDKVLVFDENKDIATNRLKILNYLLNIFQRIGTFDYIQL